MLTIMYNKINAGSHVRFFSSVGKILWIGNEIILKNSVFISGVTRNRKREETEKMSGLPLATSVKRRNSTKR